MRRIKTDKNKLRTNILLLSCLITLFISLFISLIVAEIILRAFFPIQSQYFAIELEPYAFQLDPELGYTQTPDKEFKMQWPESSSGTINININRYGFRDKDYSKEEIENTDFVILGVGDSMTFGAGIEENETFLNILEEELGRQGIDSIVINTGTSGYGVTQEHRAAKRYVPIFKPDIVILNYFGNDIREDYYFNLSDRWFLIDGVLAKSGGHDVSPVQKMSRYLDRLYVFRYVMKVLSGNPIAYKALGQIRKTQKLDLNFEQYLENYSEEMNENWIRTRTELEHLNNYLKQMNISFVIVIIPSRVQVNPNLRKAVALSNNMELGDFDFRKVNKLLGEFSKENGIILIDTMPEIGTAPNPDAYYFKLDGHLNREGHKLAGRTISKKIVEVVQDVKE